MQVGNFSNPDKHICSSCPNFRCQRSNSFKPVMLVKCHTPVLSSPYGFSPRRNDQSEAAVGNFINQNKLEAKGKRNVIKIFNETQDSLIKTLQSTYD